MPIQEQLIVEFIQDKPLSRGYKCKRNWRTLIKPKRVEAEGDTLTDKYGRFVAEPLERGFGITLGNALRRVLLSSIRGAAIIAGEN